MKKILYLGGALAALVLSQAVTSAHAAPPAAAYNWTGFYIGAHAGYGWGRSTWDGFPDAVNTGGFVGGVQAGYNWLLQSNLLVGIEGEVWWSNMHGGQSFALGALTVDRAVRNRWDADLALRFGVVADRTLFYVKGGGAYGNFGYDDTIIGEGVVAYSGTADRFGWLVGAGIEHALNPNWTVKTEYNYIDFGRKDTLFSNATTSGYFNINENKHIIKFGVNYLFGGPAAARR